MKFKPLFLGTLHGIACLLIACGVYFLSPDPTYSQSNSFHHVVCQKEYVIFEATRYSRSGGVVFLPLKNILMARKSKESDIYYGMIRVYDGGKEGRWIKTDENNIDRVITCLKSRIR